LAPYTANINTKEQNFMWQLKNNGLIEHNVVTFYIRAVYGNSSSIKFGSIDEQGIAIGGAMAMY
jgi:hypothetical protein